MAKLFSVPRIGLALFVLRDDKIMLHKRLSKHAHGKWALPGGHLDLWESFEEGVLRELREEAGGVGVTYPQLITVKNTPFPDEGKHYICIFYVSKWIFGEPQVMEPEKNGGWEWFELNDLPENLMNPQYLGIIRGWQYQQKLCDPDWLWSQ